MKIETSISQWCEGKLDTAGLLSTFEHALTTLDRHRQALADTESSLNGQELAHCEELRSYCWRLLDELDASLLEAGETARSGQRAAFISAGDHIGRLAFQLNQALLEFNHQVLLVRGPTEIPALNLLYWLHQLYQSDPRVKDRYLAALMSEVALAERGVSDLDKESVDSESLLALRGAFGEHIGHLRSLARALEEGEADLTGYLLQVNLTYTEINKLGPLVSQELRDRGETVFAEINRLLTLLEEVSLGRAGDSLLFDALECLESYIVKFEEAIGDAPEGEAWDRSIAQMAEAVSCFSEAAGLVDEFGEARDIALLRAARERFLEFASLLGAVEEMPELPGLIENPVVAERLSEVYQAVDDVLTSRILVDDYLSVLDRFGRHLKRQLVSSKAENLKRPIHAMLVGLDSLRKFTRDGHEEHLKSGVLALNQGAAELQAALA